MSTNAIDFKRWEKIVREPTWYLTIVPEVAKLRENKEEHEKLKPQIYDFFEEHLVQNTIALGSSGRNWDAERQPIDTIVIHHTSNPSGMRASRLSAIELIRLYAPYYASPYYNGEEDVQGKPIYSAHVRGGRPVFYPYHWFVRQGGDVERLLLDNEIGWHAGRGKWDINCRSVAICFDGDFEHSRPSEAELQAAARIIKENYASVSREQIFGHCEINPTTQCPSRLFLPTKDSSGWKASLLALL